MKRSPDCHNPNCTITGCPRCNPLMGAYLRDPMKLHPAHPLVRAACDAELRLSVPVHDEPPSGYPVPEDTTMTPDCDPNYRHHGTPADGYLIAITAQRVRDGLPSSSRVTSTNGIPDGYATALHNAKEKNR
jgi:hypothetical protein